MSWLLRHNWLWAALAFLLGAVITWILLIRRDPRMSSPASTAPAAEVNTPAPKAETPTPKAAAPAPKAATPAPAPKAASPAPKGEAATLFDVQAEDETALVDVQAEPAKAAGDGQAEVGPYGVGSIAAPADGSVPDGYTVKGNAQSMLFHTTDSPYYGRTKPEVWFRTEADAAAAGFTKYERRRKK